MNNWGKVAAGVVLGVAGTIYATSEEARKNLPKAARDLPVNVRRRYQNAVSAAREASLTRREEILRDLEQHDRAHAGRAATAPPETPPAPQPIPEQPTAEQPIPEQPIPEQPIPEQPPTGPSAPRNVREDHEPGG